MACLGPTKVKGLPPERDLSIRITESRATPGPSHNKSAFCLPLLILVVREGRPLLAPRTTRQRFICLSALALFYARGKSESGGQLLRITRSLSSAPRGSRSFVVVLWRRATTSTRARAKKEREVL